jgi:hypothetical protein
MSNESKIGYYALKQPNYLDSGDFWVFSGDRESLLGSIQLPSNEVWLHLKGMISCSLILKMIERGFLLLNDVAMFL